MIAVGTRVRALYPNERWGEDVIVEAAVLEPGDHVRRPVPGAEELVVESTDRYARVLRVRSLDDGTTFDMPWNTRAKWLVLLANADETGA